MPAYTPFTRAGSIMIVALLLCLKAWAIDERYAAQPLQGNQLRKDSLSTVSDTVYFNAGLKPLQLTNSVRNIITFKLNEFANIALPDSFSVYLTYKLYFTRDQGGTAVQDSMDERTLIINYKKNGTYSYKAFYTFKGGYRVQVKITGITVTKTTLATIENALMLENEVLVNREYNFSCTANAITAVSKDTTAIATKGELKVNWSADRAADEYDLEWTYIDNTALPNFYKSGSTTVFDPKKLFTNNASRVSIKELQYFIPLLYDNNGVLFFRVRPVQVKASGQRLEANWSSDYSNGLGRYDFAGHENLLNWQAATSFAEDGKRKSVVQYFDGSLRNRQTVTKDNTTDTTVVAETFYDYQGRPVIQVLPSPSLSSLIKYTPGFNRLNGAEYDKDLYDGLLADSCYCREAAPAMDSLYGAARYYSPANPLAASGYHQYIPDARKIPFAETRYTPDNTGRIAIQSGAGPDFRIGTGHETRYFYGAADQEELDALFGTEAGNAAHYFKNMVRDANGQYSISYVDMHGRTVATALAGKPVAKLDTLASNKTINLTKKLLDSNSNVLKGTMIESSKGLVVTRAGNHRFRYSLLPDSISLKDCSDTAICYDCMYDLEMTITDECNNATLPGGLPLVVKRTNYRIDTACNANTSFPAIDTTFFLSEGTYLVTKKLSVNSKGMDYYRDSVFVRRNTCKSLQQFIAEQKTLLAQSIQCAPTCQSCLDSLGSWTVFRPRYLQRLGIANSDTAAYQKQAWDAFQQASASCSELCNTTGLHTSLREQMLADVSPPYGQYADTSNIDPYSLFWRNLSRTDRYTSNTDNFVDENGQPDALRDPAKKRDVFLEEFKSCWAPALLPLHPEYQKLVKYEQLAASHAWDERFGNTSTYQAAVDSGFLNPGNFTTRPAGTVFQYNSAHGDPLFTSLVSNGTVAASYKTLMQTALLQVALNTSNNAISAWSMATIMAHCPGGDGTCLNHYQPLDSAFKLSTTCSGELDIAWQYFRELYLQKKREIVYQIIDAYYTNLVYPPADFAALAQQGHTLNFADPAVVPDGVPGTESSAQDSLQYYISDNCKAYATQWWQQLSPCNFTAADSARLIPRLIDICREGGDANRFFGASTVKPASSYPFRSFEQLLQFYCDSTGKSYNATCNVYLLEAPAPYDQQPVYYDKPVFQKPDSCECARINNLYTQYQANTALDTSFAAYVFRTTGTRMYDGVLDTLRQACNGTINCSFLKEQLTLPPVLQCGVQNSCVDCAQIKVLYREYRTSFPDALPDRDYADSMQAVKNNLFMHYMNTRLGFSKQLNEYLDFIDSCSIPADSATLFAVTDTASATCAQLNSLVAEYYYAVVNPLNRVAVVDMRTFAGNKTPATGPKGVFDINGSFLGRTVDGTNAQVDSSFADIWNNGAANKATGKLLPLGNGKFQLHLSAGATVPCNGVTGMRYYQFNVHTKDTLRFFGTGIGCYIDFGDSTNLTTATTVINSKTRCNRYDLSTAFYQYSAMVGSDFNVPSRFDITHYYTHNAQPQTYTITVYHLDTLGSVRFNDYLPPNRPTQFSNLRGYFPQHTLEFTLNGTHDSTFNRSSEVRNFSQLTSLQYIELRQNDFGSPFVMNKLGSFANNHGLRHLRLDNSYVNVPNYLQPGVVDSVAGRHYYENFPNLSTNFPDLRLIYIASWNTREQDLAWFDFKLPKLKRLDIPFFNIPAGVIDTIYNQLDRTTLINNGQVALGYSSTSAPPTAASAAAKSALLARGWYLSDPATSMSFPPHGAFDLSGDDTLPLVQPFTDFMNQRLGTHFTYAALQQYLRGRCGTVPAFCNAPATGSRLLCGKTEPAFPVIALKQHSPCDDSTLFAVSKGTLLYEAYRDSLLNIFNNRYLAKCLEARYHETFTVDLPISEYHYTLYYYDQAGNLVKTVPPAGVDVSKFGWVTAWSDSVKTARRNRQLLVPQHGLPTQYRYNALNQVVAQKSPDGGKTDFWYDRLGRLAISRNARQLAAGATEDNRQYSYTRYDGLGRITEVGQVKNTAANGGMTNAIARNETSLNSWLTTLNSRREQITNTVYDVTYSGFTGISDNRLLIQQRNLRNRVSYTTYTEGSNPVQYNQGSFYTYDIHGNVDTLLQDYGSSAYTATANLMNKNNNRWKKMAYKYDLISGKVNMVMYQRGWSDQLFHRYSYDAENRLTLVETSMDSLVWERDARYAYYRHGPLARTVLGEQLVQGMDYAYTLQGWLKGMNSTGATAAQDMGGDGKAGSLNQFTAKDAIGFNLNYFTGDYFAINSTVNPFPGHTGYLAATDYRPLYNGNISSMATAIRQFNDPNMIEWAVMLKNYRYDQLNRLTGMNAYNGFDTVNNHWMGMSGVSDKYQERIAYDGNGNILQYQRNSGGYYATMDSLNYKYYTGTNRLRRVTDTIDAGRYGTQSYEIRDIDNQADTSNYTYDEIGNLIRDSSEKITGIKWNVYGKIQEINRVATTGNPVTKIVYTYDAAGNRISKVLSKTGTTARDYTWYVRDAQGNLVSTYTANSSSTDANIQNAVVNHEERYVYGSSRLGMYSFRQSVDGGPADMEYYSGGQQLRGYRQYELSNHLGNVLTTISDKKMPILSGSSLIGYEPDMINAQDYYPFGMVMRVKATGTSYRYGFNGKENDNEVKGFGNQQDYGFRIYSPALGRFLSVDLIAEKYPELTPYQFASNRPIDGIDLDGKEWKKYIKKAFEVAIGPPPMGVVADKEFGQGYSEAAQRTVNDIKQLLNNFLKPAKGLDPNLVRTTIADPNIGRIRNEYEMKMGQAVEAVISQYAGLFKRAAEGDKKALGELAFEATIMLVTEGYGKLIKATGLGARVSQAFRSAKYALGFTEDLPMFPSMGPLDAGEKFIGKAGGEILGEVEDLIRLNGGKNSVTIETETQKIRYDLAGKAHGGVSTPHKQIYNKNFVDGAQKSVSRATKEAIPMTQEDIDIVKKYLTGQQNGN